MENKRAGILGFRDTDQSKIALVGGKGANLGELSRIPGLQVPGGFCITTGVYRELVAHHEALWPLLDQLTGLKADNRKVIRELSAKIRAVIEAIKIPEDITKEIINQLGMLGGQSAYAIRSSATAEDLPTASFAGQQDTYLNVIGEAAILAHISKCWASLFTERAIIYRLQNGFDHRKVYLAVVVQKMIFPEVAGIMFTADPVSSNRKVISIDAGFGLGEALVAGLVNPDNYKVSDGKVIEKQVPLKELAIYALKDGGTKQQELTPEQQHRQALTEEQVLNLEGIGRKIEAHFGSPQDIEWCWAGGTFYIVQSRPITTLYPIPEAKDLENHVYVSVGHNQMMTDAMKPLGLSFFLLTTRAPMRSAGGRLFVDITQMLAAPGSRNVLLNNTLGKSDPLIKDALMTIIARENFIRPAQDVLPVPDPGDQDNVASPVPKEVDPAIVADLTGRSRTAIAELKQNIRTKSGPELFDFIGENIQQLKKLLADPKNMEAIMATVDATSWINEKMKEWLGEKNVADILAQSVADNITSEMGLELLDVADVIRPYPEVIACLQAARENKFLEQLPGLNGGKEARQAIDAYLDKYGMRCSGEIDITKKRWFENPLALVPVILGNIKNFAPGESKRKFEQGLQEALKKEKSLLSRLSELPGGAEKVDQAKRMIDQLRNFSGYREFPKYCIVSHYCLYKQALEQEAEQLVQAGLIREKEDVYYLTFEEFRDTVRTHKADYEMINARKEEHKIHEKLNPPRVITSDGEIITGQYKRADLPAGAIAGLAVSSGVIEGRARVILNMEDAEMEEGDILVTAFTDPSWTPLFVAIKGLVTEVGGLMTHGAVIAREYGLPAVVGVEYATQLIKNGQRIRVNGTDGYVEIL